MTDAAHVLRWIMTLWVLTTAAAVGQVCRGPPFEYNTSSAPENGNVNVHFVMHSHDDVGWLKTVDQYFLGTRVDLGPEHVDQILDTVVQNLAANPDRKFIQVEQAFFQMWWRRQTQRTRALVTTLVNEGRLEFVNGGWCMHDEATTHFVDMIDQIALGHRYIKEQFGKVPRVGWQIDPFGHSSVQASLMTAEMGFDGLFFARADYQDINARRANKGMEMIWRASRSLGKSAETFAGILHAHYMPPRSFNYEAFGDFPDVQDDPCLESYNLKERLDTLVADNLRQAAQFRTNHIMLTMGADFSHSNADAWFMNVDKLIHAMNRDGRVNAFYSTPSLYIDAKHAANESWPVKTDDFFPYADCPHCYWTGFFSSRVNLKGYVRALSARLQAARQLEFLTGRPETGPTTDSLEEALAVVQHHDGVSGTSKQHVADDYAKRLAAGAAEAESVITSGLLKLAELKSAPPRSGGAAGQNSTFSEAPVLQLCPLLNISFCPPTTNSLQAGSELVVLVYNPLAWPRRELVTLPVSDTWLVVTDADGRAVPSQLAPIDDVSVRLRQQQAPESSGSGVGYELTFWAASPPLGFATYFIGHSSAASSDGAAASAAVKEYGNGTGASFQVGTGSLRLRFENGRLTRFESNGTSLQIRNQTLFSYTGSRGFVKGENAFQASGAYIFRPESLNETPVDQSSPMDGTYPRISVVRGPLYEEVRQELSSWASIALRVPSDGQDVQLRYTVGPLSSGREVVLRLEADVRNERTFWTDSNGRDFMKRVVDYRPSWNLSVTDPVAGNYYPVNAAIAIRDAKSQLTVLTDRSLGGTSLRDGQIDLMVHRRSTNDDGRGVGEPLDEKQFGQGMVTRGTLRVGVHEANAAARWWRRAAVRQYQPLELAIATQIGGREAWLAQRRGGASALMKGSQLPPNVALVTLQQLARGPVLLRLAHLFETDEDRLLSRPARVDLRALFAKEVSMVTEMTLSGNQPRAAVRRKVWRVENEEGPEVKDSRGPILGPGRFVVEIGPMEVRTFEVVFGHKQASLRMSWAVYSATALVLVVVAGLIVHVTANAWWRKGQTALPGYESLSRPSTVDEPIETVEMSQADSASAWVTRSHQSIEDRLESA